ncbi:MAG: ABC transporter permease [Bacteroidales bacterium]|nr:ABC transporter permease [Bacteroidales bacterium]MBN2748958.1 ABC transporter permease [Bacteroidales bacterium]
MIKFHFLLALRNMMRNKLFSFITILGLATGLTVTLLLTIYVRHEFSYNNFHEKKDRIYRVVSQLGTLQLNDYDISLRLNDSILSNSVPELEHILQLYGFGRCTFVESNKQHKSIPFDFVDPTIFDVLTFSFLEGSKESAFAELNSVVVTRSIAERIFGTVDVVGKSIVYFDSNHTVTISAVVDDFPSNSDWAFGVIARMDALPYLNVLGGLEFNTLLQYRKGSNMDQATKKTVEAYNAILNDRFGKYDYNTGSYLQPFKDIHLNSSFNSPNGIDARLRRIYVFLFMAIIVLVVAMINYVNLLTVQYQSRTREVGVQKTLGASRWRVAFQFIGSSVLLSVVALIIASILVELLLPSFGSLLRSGVVEGYRNDTLLKVITPLVAICLGVIAGLYPAVFVSGFNPYKAIKGDISKSGGVQRFIKVLVVFQFGVAIFLISSLIVMQRQIDYMKNADLGVDSKRVVAVMGLNESMVRSYKSISEALLQNPNIEQVSASGHLFGGGTSGQGINSYEESPKKTYGINEYRIQPGYCELMGMQFIVGRPFDANISSDSAGIILNEAAIRMLSLKDPLNAKVEFASIGPETKIIGVVKDFNYESLEKPVAPLMLSMYREWINFIMVKHADIPVKEVLDIIESTIKRFDSSYSLEYIIVEDTVRNKYQSQEQTSKLTNYSALLSIILSLLGLYALSMYLVGKRTKEIGIRKVNGATRIQILGLLLQTYTMQVLLAFVLVAPVAYYFMREWLNGFAYRINLGFMPFAIAGLLCLVVALLTVGFQTWRATGRNPVESLRYE